MMDMSEVDQTTDVTGWPVRFVPPKKNWVCIANANDVLPLVIVTLPLEPIGCAGLHAPNVLVDGPNQTPVPARWTDLPTTGAVVSSASIAVDVKPAAGPLVAVNVPSYDLNSVTWPCALTNAQPSGDPLWIVPRGLSV